MKVFRFLFESMVWRKSPAQGHTASHFKISPLADDNSRYQIQKKSEKIPIEKNRQVKEIWGEERREDKEKNTAKKPYLFFTNINFSISRE